MKKKTLKEQILQIFLESPDDTFSGEALASKLSVSRTAVWKAIGALRTLGYRIEGTPKRGYRLIPGDGDEASSERSDRFNAAEIHALLPEEARGFYDIHTVSETGSTNSDVREAGIAGAAEGYVLLAESQTAGRGRQGRSFYSPKGSGLYMSLLLRPSIPARDAVLITAAAGVAAARAVETLLQCSCPEAAVSLSDHGFPVRIKWVNDLFLHDRKICGILTEGMLSLETGGFSQAVLGLGFNLSAPDQGWPEEIRGIAGGLFETEDRSAASADQRSSTGEHPAPTGARVRLAAAFLTEFLPLYQQLGEKTFLPEYRTRQLVLGQTIDVLEPDGSSVPAEAVDLDDHCRLLVRYKNNPDLVPLQSGEVRIKPRS